MLGIDLRMTAAPPENIILLFLVYLLYSNYMHDTLNTYIYQIPLTCCSVCYSVLARTSCYLVKICMLIQCYTGWTAEFKM